MISAARAILKKRVPGLYDAARFLRLKGEKVLFREYTATHHYGGHELSVIIADRVGKEWYDHDVERPSSFDFFDAKGLTKGARCFLLGAHQAVVSMILARNMSETGSIVAVEGNIENYTIGNRNLALNKIDHVTLLHAVVGATDGQLSFSQSHNGMVELNGGRLSSRRVPSVSIDSLANQFGRPDVVMLDIEGYETHALEGAVQTLQSTAAWYVEIHGNSQLGRYGKRNQDVVDVFRKDFDLFFSPDDIAPFVPAHSFGEIPADRFFLIALARR
jgi:FkbM family methyltransferase